MSKQELSIEEMNAEMLALMEVASSEIEELPEFITPPVGNYVFNVEKFELAQQDDGKQYINVLLSLVNVIETANPEHMETAMAFPAGSLVSQRYYGAFGIQKLKSEWGMVIENLVGADGSIANFMDTVVGCEVGVSTSLRKDKDDPEKVYVGFRKVLIAA